jgi:iron complex outermembrane receptor protein
MNVRSGRLAPLMIRLCAATAVSAPLFMAAVAHAQTAPQPVPSETSASPSDVVVTAAKRRQRVQDVPASIVAKTGVELEREGVVTLSDVINNTPGLSNPGNGGANWTNLTIRGVNTSTTNGLQQSTVAQLYDDITLDPIADAGTTNLRLVDVERVEVLRGPQGTLFGSGALAGAIRYITNKPNLDTYSGNAEVTLAGTETGNPSWNGAATVNLPLVTDKLGLRVVGYDYHDGDWITDLRDGTKLGGSDTYGLRATLRARPTDKLTVDLTAMYQDSADHGAGDSLYYPPAGHSGQVSDGAVNEAINAKSLITGLNVQYDLGVADLVSETSVQQRHFDYNGFDYYYVPSLTNGALNGIDYDHSPNDANIYTQELRLSSKGTGPLKWTFGGYYLQGDVYEQYYQHSPLIIPLAGGADIADLIVHGVQAEIAGFGDVTYTLFGNLDLSAGARVAKSSLDERIHNHGYAVTGFASPTPFRQKELHENDNPVTPHFSITYRYTPQLTLYVSAAEGFRVGGINETAGPARPTEPQSYGPDTLWNYEGGAKGRAFDGRLSYSVDVYYINWNNLQIPVSTGLGNYTGNASAATLYGVEGQFDAKLTDALQVGASVNISHNTVSKNDPAVYTDVGLEPIYKGYLLPASPEQQGSVYAEYDFRVAGYNTYIRGSGNYIGPEWTGFAKQGIKFGDYATADIRAGVVINRFEVVGYVDNLFNSQGKQSASQALTSGSLILINQAAYRIRPLTGGVTLRARF